MGGIHGFIWFHQYGHTGYSLHCSSCAIPSRNCLKPPVHRSYSWWFMGFWNWTFLTSSFRSGNQVGDQPTRLFFKPSGTVSSVLGCHNLRSLHAKHVSHLCGSGQPTGVCNKKTLFVASWEQNKDNPAYTNKATFGLNKTIKSTFGKQLSGSHSRR